MLITMDIFEELENCRKKVERFQIIKNANVLRPQYDEVVARTEKRFEELKAWVKCVLAEESFDAHLAVKNYYFYGLTLEEISTHIFFGIKSEEEISAMISNYFVELKKLNAKGLPQVPDTISKLHN